MTPISALRTLAAILVAPTIAWSLHNVIGDSLALLQLSAPDWRYLLTTFYGYLFVGFVFAGVAAKLAPGRGSRFVTVVLLGSVLAGAILGLDAQSGRVAAVTIALAVVAGTVGYSFRLRGFTEALHSN